MFWKFPHIETVKTSYQAKEFAPLLKLRKEISYDFVIKTAHGLPQLAGEDSL